MKLQTTSFCCWLPVQNIVPIGVFTSLPNSIMRKGQISGPREPVNTTTVLTFSCALSPVGFFQFRSEKKAEGNLIWSKETGSHATSRMDGRTTDMCVTTSLDMYLLHYCWWERVSLLSVFCDLEAGCWENCTSNMKRGFLSRQNLFIDNLVGEWIKDEGVLFSVSYKCNILFW